MLRPLGTRNKSLGFRGVPGNKQDSENKRDFVLVRVDAHAPTVKVFCPQGLAPSPPASPAFSQALECSEEPKPPPPPSLTEEPKWTPNLKAQNENRNDQKNSKTLVKA